mmetsp:Transcript_18221/g.39719  ORF Transcript_18221/g.39719 Transcript_18221/m.39719 type:complete len:171 (+) Transcript_18221:139-651(+)
MSSLTQATRRCSSSTTMMVQGRFSRRKRTCYHHRHLRQQHSSVRGSLSALACLENDNPALPSRRNSPSLGCNYDTSTYWNKNAADGIVLTIKDNSSHTDNDARSCTFDSSMDSYILPLENQEESTTIADNVLASWLAAEAVMKMMDTSHYHASHKSTTTIPTRSSCSSGE